MTQAREADPKQATSLVSTFRDPNKRPDSLNPSNIDTNRLSTFLDQDQAFIFQKNSKNTATTTKNM